ncbi:hypothetical protein [Luteococcus sp.]|uniref:hypothetical protein n=1 Tax=Luteococcus sp. TaxID=1969402 RepID=UPI0037351859
MDTTSNQTPAPTTRAAQARTGQSNTSQSRAGLRRTLAGLLAAGTIAFGGLGTLSPADASAAGVRQQAVVVQTSSLPVASATTGAEPRRGGE